MCVGKRENEWKSVKGDRETVKFKWAAQCGEDLPVSH